MLSSNCHQKWSTWAPFLTPYLVTSKDIATKTTCLDDVKIHADQSRRRWDTCRATDIKNYSRFNIQQNTHQRLSDKKGNIIYQHIP